MCCFVIAMILPNMLVAHLSKHFRLKYFQDIQTQEFGGEK